MNTQCTLKKAIEFRGKGLHTGKEATIILHPAKPDSGIIFRRTDVFPNVEIPALNRYVVDTRLSTTLGRDGITIATVEHLMSAIWGLGIDNLLIDIQGAEIPILDGSSLFFSKGIRRIGLVKQDQVRKCFVITKPISTTQEDRYCYLLPSKTEKFSCSIEFNHPLIQKQSFELTLNPKNYYKDISRARTFGFLKDVKRLREQGLITGGSLENAIVLDHQGVLNKEGLRCKDEFVRHKLLDMIGDVALMGVRILGHFVFHKTGHDLHYKLIQRALIEECGYMNAIDEGETKEARREFPPLVEAVSI